MSLAFSFLILISFCLRVTLAGPEYDFEDPQEANVFNAENAKGTRTISTLHHKSGSHSLLWQWTARSASDPPAKLTISLGPTLKLKEKELNDGGLKFWMYRETTGPATTMEIVFRGEKGSSSNAVATSPTIANLNFKGWRGVWIGYQEFGSEIKSSFTAITSVEFRITSNSAGKLILDAVRFATSIRKQSRDLVVPKVGSASRSNESSFYDDKDFWQQSLRWFVTPLPRTTTEIPNVDAKIREIQGIEARLENWYANVNEPLKTITTYDDFAVDMAMDPEGGIDYQVLKQQRWKLLQTDIEAANTYYHKINFIKKRPPLFSKVEELGEDSISEDLNFKSKFGFFFAKILLPLSLEYNFMSREAEVSALANRVCNNLKSNNYLTMLQAITEITGGHHILVDTFQTILDTYKKNFTCSSTKAVDQVNAADLIHLYNEIRWERIKALLIFIEDQGWAQGSGLGSIDHEMNKAGSGFMHSMFLLRKTLRRSSNAALLNRLLGAMKWYNDFNEIYQDESNYIYDGTTADRMRTILLYRLMIILITPDSDKETKIRHLQQLRIWMKHALKVNKGLGGVIKADFTGFHHKTFYGSAYVPHALHNAALVQYLLEGTTNFKLDDESKSNLRKALSVLRMTAVKYSSPNGVGGRFPGYNNSILAQHFAAYAYISYSKEGSTEKAKGRDMFLRLFNHLEPSVKDYLEDGIIKSGIYYWNPIGQIDVFKQITTLPCTVQCSAEGSPEGHWSKNYAGLSIHRRSNWAIAAKGFNRYTWDYEGNGGENVFGTFASHGSLQISNSERSLSSNDVTQGWDWTRVPGATTIKAELSNIALSKARNYNPGNFAGGVSFIGSTGSKPRNGAFGMFYKKPKYNLSKNKASPMDKMVFEFKKSYFFYNNLIVCLGSDIKFQSRDVENYYAQTTLFQDKLVDPSKSSTIKYGTTIHDLRLLLNRQYRWTNGATVTLVDTNGNTYQVKNAREQGLNIQVQDQDSVASNGCDKTKARYATAWIEHKNRQTLPCSTKTLADNVRGEPPPKEEEESTTTDYNEKDVSKESENVDSTENEDNDNEIKTKQLPTLKRVSSSIITSQNDKMIKKHKLSPKHPDITLKTSNVVHRKPSFANQNSKNAVVSKTTKKVHPIKSKTNAVKSKTNKGSKLNRNSTDYIFVNGINVNLGSNEPLQTAEVSDYKEPSIDYSNENILDADNERPMFLQSHVDKSHGIDEEDDNSPTIDKNVDSSDIKDGIDDAKDSMSSDDMDGLGTDIDYNDDGSATQLTESANPKTTFSMENDTTIPPAPAPLTATEPAKAATEASIDSPEFETEQSSEAAQEPFDTGANATPTTTGKVASNATLETQTTAAAVTTTKLTSMNKASLTTKEDKNILSMETDREEVSSRDDNLSKPSSPDYEQKDETATTKLGTIEDLTPKGQTRLPVTTQKAAIETSNDSSTNKTEPNTTANEVQHEESVPARRAAKVDRMSETSTTESFMPKAVDAAMPSSQDPKTTSVTSKMSKETKTNSERNSEQKHEQYDDNKEQPSTQNLINRTDSKENSYIDTPPIDLKDAINGTLSSDNQNENVDSNIDESETKMAEDNGTIETSGEESEQDANEIMNKSIDDHIIGSKAEKSNDNYPDETSKASEQNDDTTRNDSIDNHIIGSKAANGKDIEDKDTNKEKVTKKHDREKMTKADLTKKKTKLEEQHNKGIKDEEMKVGEQASLNDATFDGKTTQQLLRTDKGTSKENMFKYIQTTKEKQESKNANHKIHKNLKFKSTKKASNHESRDIKKINRKRKPQVADNHSSTETNNDDTLNKIIQTRADFLLKNSLPEGNNPESEFPDSLNEQQKRKLKVMKQKHNEVKRKMKIKLKIKAKSATYNKLHKAMKIAIKNVQEVAKENEEKNKNTFYFNNTLTNEENSSEGEIIDQNADAVDENASYNDDADHSDTTSTTTSSYEYAIIVQGGSLSLFSRYNVIAKTSTLHAVEFSNLPDYTDASAKLYAYSIFQTFAATESVSTGPVIKTSMPCMIMAELRTNTLYLALSNPAITFQDDHAMKNKDTCTKVGRKDIPDKFSPVNSDEVGAKMMFCVEGASTNITVSLRLTKGLSTILGSTSVKVDGQVQLNGSKYVSVNAASKEVTFVNLINGFTTEVALRLV